MIERDYATGFFTNTTVFIKQADFEALVTRFFNAFHIFQPGWKLSAYTEERDRYVIDWSQEYGFEANQLFNEPFDLPAIMQYLEEQNELPGFMSETNKIIVLMGQ